MGETTNCFEFINTVTTLLGCFPVGKKGNKITFKWYSLKTFCFFALFLLSLMHFTLNVYENALGYVIMVVDVSGIVMRISIFIMAMNWPDLAKECDKIDFHMKRYGFPKYLKLKLHVICAVMMTVDLALYCLYDMHISKNPTFELHTFIGVWRSIARYVEQDLFFVGACKLLIIILRQLSHWQLTILRHCLDIFVITASVMLTMRFGQIAERIDLLIQKKVRDDNTWVRIREDYQRLCMFCEKWDNVLGYFVLPSFMSNIYLLLLHIQAALRVTEKIDQIHTTFAVIDNLVRIIIICYTAGNVYIEIRKILRLLLLTPSNLFNDEIERMILQIRQSQPALTGKQLFTVKHSLILQILGGIAVHEIILLQYYAPD